MGRKPYKKKPYRNPEIKRILDDIRRDIVLGVYPVGTYIKSVTKISKEYEVSICSGYKIHQILEEEGLIRYVKDEGGIVIPFDQDFWLNKIHNDSLQNLSEAIDICKTSQVPKEQVAMLIQNAYLRQPKPIMESENA